MRELPGFSRMELTARCPFCQPKRSFGAKRQQRQAEKRPSGGVAGVFGGCREGVAVMLYKIHRHTVIIIVPMFFLNLFPVYRAVPGLLLLGMYFWGTYVLVHYPLNRIDANRRLPAVIISWAVMLAVAWLIRDAYTSGGYTSVYGATAAPLMLYPFIKKPDPSDPFFEFFRKDRARIYRARALGIVLIVSVCIAMYFGDPFPQASDLLRSGSPPVPIIILSVYSFALTNVFYRLESKIFRKSGKDTGAYNTWLVLPAFTLSTLFPFVYV
jgi:hypothetical protein